MFLLLVLLVLQWHFLPSCIFLLGMAKQKLGPAGNLLSSVQLSQKRCVMPWPLGLGVLIMVESQSNGGNLHLNILFYPFLLLDHLRPLSLLACNSLLARLRPLSCS